MIRKLFLISIMIIVLATGCQPSNAPVPVAKGASSQVKSLATTAAPQVIPTQTAVKVTSAPAASATPQPSQTPNAQQLISQNASPTPADISAPSGNSNTALVSGPVGPDSFPAGVNPLTGLPVADPTSLQLPPALVSITNFPPTARPQAGLSYSSVVYELYIGEGMTRFLAVFYGDYPPKNSPVGKSANTAVGPIRSGRLPYEKLRLLYSGFLVMASGYESVLKKLDEFTNIFGSDKNDINSAMVDVAKLEQIAANSGWKIKEDYLTGQSYDPAAQPNGVPGKQIWIPFSYLDQVLWRYDPASGAYHRYQDKADGINFVQATDRINGEPLTYENIVILFVDHHAQNEQVIDLDFMYITKMPALLFRDGQMYPVFWTTRNSEYEKKTGRIRPIRFIDSQGNSFPLKPGQTWIELVPRDTPYSETVDSQVYFDLMTKKQPGSGNWAIYFYPPPVEEE